jgi:hypothetical protein
VEGALVEYRVTITIAEHGFSDEAADRCLDAFLALDPAAGPVVSQNAASGHLSVTIAVEATDPWAAANLSARIFTKGLEATGLAVTPIIDVSVTQVESENLTCDDRELVRA